MNPDTNFASSLHLFRNEVANLKKRRDWEKKAFRGVMEVQCPCGGLSSSAIDANSKGDVILSLSGCSSHRGMTLEIT